MPAKQQDPAEPPGARRPGGALEAEIIGLLQAAGRPLTPGQVREHLKGELSYSTVVTVLSRMYDKGLTTRAKQGRAYAYAPLTDAHGMTARRMRQVLDSDPDRKAVLSRFVDELPAGDEELLRRLLGADLPGER